MIVVAKKMKKVWSSRGRVSPSRAATTSAPKLHSDIKGCVTLKSKVVVSL